LVVEVEVLAVSGAEALAGAEPAEAGEERIYGS
jgi:hypothetical protein